MININSIQKYFPLEKDFFGRVIKKAFALDNVSIQFPERQITGIVGESGSGKSTLARILCGVFKPDNGSFSYGEFNSLTMKHADWKNYRRNVQMVFQDPFSSLNPRMRINDILMEPLIIHKETGKDKILTGKKIENALLRVGLSPDALSKYPHEFSGGQRQRIAIARALMLNPDVVIFDEAVSALDVSIQAQILNLILDLQKELKMTFLFIAHDLSVVSYVSETIAVMYAGKIVEFNTTNEVFSFPRHPYTRLLLDSIPQVISEIHADDREDGINDYTINVNRDGCPFYYRCPQKQSICQNQYPQKTYTMAQDSSEQQTQNATGEKQNQYYFECFNPMPALSNRK